MGGFLSRIKIPVIVMGVVFVLLALFFVPGIARLQYEASIDESKSFNIITAVFEIGDVVVVKLQKQTVVNELFNHIIARHDNVV